MASRTYGQFCGLARALDSVGDRWNLLIVRELLLGPRRYNELKNSLAGIATNLLADRLRDLESSGIVERRVAPTGIAYALTVWGEGLREPIESLIRWSSPIMATGQGQDSFEPHWLTLALPALLRGATANPAVELGIRVDGYELTLRIDEHGPSAEAGPAARPASVLDTTAEVILGLAAGALSSEEALTLATLTGDRRALHRAFPVTRN